MTVDILHHLAGIEAVGLSEIDEQAFEALFRFACATVAASLATLSALPATSVTATFFLHHANLRCIGIIRKELSKLQTDDFLYHILLVDVFEVAADVVHERSNLFLINVGLQYLIHHLEELLLADFLRFRYLSLNKLLADGLLHGPNLMTLTGVYDGNRRTFLSRAARSAASMGVALYVIRHTVVYHVRQIVHVETARSHVGSHEQLREMLAELLHREVALLLRQVAVQALCVVAVLYQLVGNLLCLHFRAAEDNREDARIIVYDALQSKVFVLRVHHIIYVVHIFRALVAASHHNFLIVVQIALGYFLNLLAHRCREQQRVTVFGNTCENLVDALRESHVQHLVGLVKHYVVHLVKVGLLPVHQVDESSRSGNDNLRPVSQRTDLRLDRRTAIHRHHIDTFYILAEIVQVIGDLQAQLARRTEHKCLCGPVRRVYPLQDGNTKRRCLARTGLCQCDNIVSVAKQIRDNLLLNGHRLFKTEFLDSAANILAHAQFFKCLQFKNPSYIVSK